MSLNNNTINTSSLVADNIAKKVMQDEQMGLDLRTMGGEGSKEAKVRRVAIQFEEMLINTLLKSAFKDKEAGEKEEEDEEPGITFGRVNDLRNMFLSQHIADNGGLGYRQVIEEQIKQAYFSNGQSVEGQKGGATTVGASNNVVLRPPDPPLPTRVNTTSANSSTNSPTAIHTNPVSRTEQSLSLLPADMTPPVDSDITSSFGWRQDPIDGETRFHYGIDFKVPSHTPVKSVMAGEVVFSGWEAGYGKMVEIKHANGLTSRYGHNSKLTVKVGDQVEAGTVIAQSGSTGRSTGPHLHFEIRKDDQALDPIAFFQEKNTNVLAKNAEIPNVDSKKSIFSMSRP